MVMKLAEQKSSKSRRKRSRPDLEMIAEGVRLILEGIGEDPDRAGLKETHAGRPTTTRDSAAR
jgi:GTP cyclohydrolase I